MFTITNHQRFVNWKHSEIDTTSYPWVLRMWRKWEPQGVGGGVKWCSHSKNSLAGPDMAKHWVTIWPSCSTPKFIPKRNENICLHKSLQTNGHSGASHNSQKVETTQMSVKDPGGKPRWGNSSKWLTSECFPTWGREKTEMGKFLLEHFCCA